VDLRELTSTQVILQLTNYMQIQRSQTYTPLTRWSKHETNIKQTYSI